MEYAPIYCDCQTFERVQRRATKCDPEFCNLEYEHHKSALNLPSLTY